jgi:hypothetical protein
MYDLQEGVAEIFRDAQEPIVRQLERFEIRRRERKTSRNRLGFNRRETGGTGVRDTTTHYRVGKEHPAIDRAASVLVSRYHMSLERAQEISATCRKQVIALESYNPNPIALASYISALWTGQTKAALRIYTRIVADVNSPRCSHEYRPQLKRHKKYVVVQVYTYESCREPLCYEQSRIDGYCLEHAPAPRTWEKWRAYFKARREV